MQQEQLTPFQEMLTEAYKHYCEQHNSRRASDNQFARWLGVNPATFNQWINGNRLPSYEKAIILSKRLGPEVFDVLGYERPNTYGDTDDLRFVALHWRDLDAETRQTILAHVQEIVEGKQGDGNN